MSAASASVRATMIVGTPADVGGQPGGDEVADRPGGRQQHLAAHVAALLLGRELVLEMDAGRARLDHRLGQLEHVQVAAEAGLHVGDDRDQPVDVVVALGVVDLVGAQQRAVDAANDLGDGVDRVEALVRVHLAREVRVGGDLPAAQVDRLEPGADLLDGLVAGRGAQRRDVVALVQQPPQLLGAQPRQRVLDLHGAAQPLDVLGLVRPLDPLPTLSIGRNRIGGVGGHGTASWTVALLPKPLPLGGIRKRRVCVALPADGGEQQEPSGTGPRDPEADQGRERDAGSGALGAGDAGVPASLRRTRSRAAGPLTASAPPAAPSSAPPSRKSRIPRRRRHRRGRGRRRATPSAAIASAHAGPVIAPQPRAADQRARPARRARPRSRRTARPSESSADQHDQRRQQRRRPAVRRCRRRSGTPPSRPGTSLGSSTGNGSPSAPLSRRRRNRAPAASDVRCTPCSPANAVSSISAVGAERPARTSPASARHLDEPADEPDHGADDEDRRPAGAASR